MRYKVPLSVEEAAELFQSSGPPPGIEGTWLKLLNPQNPDEGHLPWDAFGAGLWEEDRG